MLYIADKGKFVMLPLDYEKVFYQSPTAKTNKMVITGYKETGKISNEDMEILEFLYKVGFATSKQLEKYCLLKNISDFINRLNFLFCNTIINKFSLVNEVGFKGKVPGDALVVYCLHEGGRQLLENYSPHNFIVWDMSDNNRSSQQIGIKLLQTEIYLHIISSKNSKILNTDFNFKFSYNREIFTLDSVFRLNTNGIVNYISFDVIRKNFDIMEVRRKLRLIEGVFCSNIWKKYFPDTQEPPIICFVVEDDATAIFFAEEVSKSTKLTNFRISTDDRLQAGLGNLGSFLKYNAESKQLTQIQYSIF